MFVLSGSDSIIANHLLPIIRNVEQVCAFDADRADICDTGFLRTLTDDVKPRVFINCAQLENLDECEYKRERAYQVNALAPGLIADICREHDILLVHFSTSYIFNGKATVPYREDDLADPVSVYGDSKNLGERKIRESGCRHLIIRVPDVYGKGGSFLHDIFRTLKTGKRISVIRGQVLAPTFCHDVAQAAMELINRSATGIYHFANSGSVLSRVFVERAVGSYIANSDKNIDYHIDEIEYEDYLSPAERLCYNVIDTGRFTGQTGLSIRDWKSALDDFMRNFHTDL